MSASLIEYYTQEETGTRDALSFIMDEETPCDHCEYRQRCAVKRLACSAFARYVQTGRRNPPFCWRRHTNDAALPAGFRAQGARRCFLDLEPQAETASRLKRVDDIWCLNGFLFDFDVVTA